MISLNKRVYGLQVLFLLLLALRFSRSQENVIESSTEKYNYDNQGDDWMGTCRHGMEQSPISITEFEAVPIELSRIRFVNYNKKLMMPITMTNTGLTASIDLTNITENIPTISRGMMKGKFEAQSVHFHWGSPTNPGSEHIIEYQQLDAEMHIVHKNTLYSHMNVEEASSHPNGIAVLAVLIQMVPPSPSGRYALHKIFNALPQITEYQTSVSIYANFALKELLGGIDTRQYYTYYGSLTTPECRESVTWTVFKQFISMPPEQIAKLWDLKDARSRPLINNYRTAQNLNSRTIFTRAISKCNNPFQSWDSQDSQVSQKFQNFYL